jgi:hypothetical protein
VFGMGRRQTRSQLVKSELGESFDHFMQAATHAAGGVGATVGPRATDGVDRVKGAAAHGWESTMAAFAPLAAAAADGARQAGRTTSRAGRRTQRVVMRKKEPRMSRQRWPMLAGLLAAGTAIGAAGALVMRRRKQQQWQEYDPSQPIEPTRASTVDDKASTVDAASTADDVAPTLDTPSVNSRNY